MKRQAWLELYKDSGGSWRWRRKAGNGQITNPSGEAFASKSNAKRAAVKAHPELSDYVRDVEPQFK
jgi:uncharacterized protein YegP (UPF0339 family)